MNIRSGLIYRNPKPHLVSRHAYFPSLTVLPDGRIFAAFDLGSAFESVDVRTWYAISADEGATWSAPQPVPLPKFERPFSCTCRFSVSLDGLLVGIGACWDRSRSDEGLANPQTGGFVETFPFLVRADARTLEWKPPQFIQTPLTGPFEMCSPLFYSTNGDWLMPASTWKTWDGLAPHGMQAIVMRSIDQGETWSYWQPVMDGRDRAVIHWEIKLTRLANGRILAVCWTHDSASAQDLPISFATSDDEGLTFSSPQSTALLGQTCVPIGLADGRIVLVYRRTDRPGLWGQISILDGQNWKNLGAFPIWSGACHSPAEPNSTIEQMSSLRFGLPTISILSDGSVFGAFWCVEDAVSNIRYFHFTPPR